MAWAASVPNYAAQARHIRRPQRVEDLREERRRKKEEVKKRRSGGTGCAGEAAKEDSEEG